jgi:hypothetical protein
MQSIVNPTPDPGKPAFNRLRVALQQRKLLSRPLPSRPRSSSINRLTSARQVTCNDAAGGSSVGGRVEHGPHTSCRERDVRFEEDLDLDDPWQFRNVRVS